MRFDQLSTRAQVHRIRRTAFEALSHYPIEVVGLRLIRHSFNTTFRVDTADGRRFALRINVNSQRQPAWMRAEIAWLAALSADTDLSIPTPLATRAGELTTSAPSPDLGRDLPAVLYSWLPGRELGDRATPTQMRAVGRAMAALHTHAESWSPPQGANLPLYADPLFGAADNMSTSEHPELTAERRSVFGSVFAETASQFADVYAGASPIPLHADLHQWNMMWDRGRLSVFDFDDSGMGVPMLDLATTAYYIRRVDDALEAAVHEGYAEVRPLPQFTTAQYEAVLASRNLLLLNDILVTVTADMRAQLPRYIATTTARLRHYLDTGVYRFDVPGGITSGFG